MERLEARISGRVQYVMYRDFTARTARKLGLTGEVQNKPDGTVSVIAEGTSEALRAFTRALWRGSFLSRVTLVEARQGIPSGAYTDFSINYD